jgi:membrane dipeptidase
MHPRVRILPAFLAVAGCSSQPLPEVSSTPVMGTSVETRALPPRPRADSTADLVARARGIHERVITMDTHVDIPGNYATPAADPGVRGNAQVDLVKMKEGGLDAAFFIVYVGQGPRTPEGNEAARNGAFNKFSAIHRMAEHMYPDRIGLAYRADDVARIARSGRLVAAIGIENGYVIGNDLSLIKVYHDLGARYMTLTHNGHNDIGDSNTPSTPEHNGLSPFGEQVVREMNRVGIMVDISHVGKQTMLEATRLSRAPVIASHSSTSAYANHSRNMDDEQLLALKQNGGVMQTVAFRGYVRVTPPERGTAITALRQEFGLPATGGRGGGRGGGGGGGGRGGGRGDAALDSLTADRRAEYDRKLAEIDARWPVPRPTVRDFVDHIDHAVQLIGIDHVGISSDFDGGGGVDGWNDASETFNLTLELVRRGYSEGEIAKLWSGNLLRVWRAVERVAQESVAAR